MKYGCEGTLTQEIREEAIKWLSIYEKGNRIYNGLPPTVQGAEDYYLTKREARITTLFIKMFFNITEEDLK